MTTEPEPTTKPPPPMGPGAEGPLLFEDLHKQIKEIQPMVFDGVRFMMNRPLSPNFQVSHSMFMGLMKSEYKFGAHLMGTKQVSPMESYPIMASDLNCDGCMNFNFIHMLSPRVKAKVVGSFAKSTCTGSQMSLDYKGDTFASSFTAANVDLIQNSGIFLGQHLHQLTKSISVGPEVYVRCGPHMNEMRFAAQASLGGRYEADKYHVDATVSPSGLHVSYCQKAFRNLKFGVELLTDATIPHSSAGFYYQYEIEKSHMVFRGSVDTSWNVGALIEKRFHPIPLALSLSALVNHAKNSTSVGIGLTAG